jgi:uncharacterized repeat protein (TIGR03803 family)
VHTFDGYETPGRLVVGPDGALYGFTNQNDLYAAHQSQFFRIDNQGNYTKLLSLPTNIRSGLVVGSDGAFYASLATFICGSDGPVCTPARPQGVIKLTAAGSYTIVEGPVGGQWFGAPLYPAPVAVGSDGGLYGWRPEGPVASSIASGSIVRWDSAGLMTILHTFTAEEGAMGPFTLGTDGLFYAAIPFGGAQQAGQLLRFDMAGNVTTLHDFNDVDGFFSKLAVHGRK